MLQAWIWCAHSDCAFVKLQSRWTETVLTSSGLSAGWPKSGFETMAHSRRRSLTGICSLLLLFTPVLVLLTCKPPAAKSAKVEDNRP